MHALRRDRWIHLDHRSDVHEALGLEVVVGLSVDAIAALAPEVPAQVRRAVGAVGAQSAPAILAYGLVVLPAGDGGGLVIEELPHVGPELPVCH